MSDVRGTPRPDGAAPCCADPDDHCHGTYLWHGDVGECTDPGCRVPHEAHEHTLVCAELLPPCGCR